jgi:hypothetical protein
MGSIASDVDDKWDDLASADMVLSEDYDVSETGDLDLDDIMRMNREADANKELDIGASEEDDDLLDFSNPTRDGATPLGEPGPEFDYSEALDRLSKIGKGSGPQSLGSSGSLRSPGAKVGDQRGFRNMDSPYQAPKYYSPQGSILYQGMTRELIKGLLSNSIRKPTIRSLV